MSKIRLNIKTVDNKQVRTGIRKKKSYKKFSVLIILILISLFSYILYQNYIKTDNYYYNKAVSYKEQKEYSKAIENYKKSINENPYDTKSYIELADLLNTKGQIEEAIQILDKGSTIAKNKGKIYLKKGEILMSNGNFNESLAEIQTANTIMQNPVSSYQLILNLLLSNNSNDAKIIAQNMSCSDKDTCLVKAFNDFSNLNNLQYYINKCIELDSQNNICLELKDLSQTLTGSEEEIITNYMNIAKYLIDNEIYAPALFMCDDIKFKNPYYEIPYIYKAFIYMQFNDLNSALNLLNTASIYAPDNANIYKMIASIYLFQNKLNLAEENILKAMQFSNVEDETRFIASQVFKKESKYDEALEQLGILLKENPDNFDYIKEKAFIFILEQKYNACVDLLTQDLLDKVESQEDEAILLSIDAWCLYKNNNQKEAERIFKSINNRNNATIMYFYAKYLYDNEEFDKAKKYFTKALDLDLSGEYTKDILKNLDLLKENE